MNRITCGVLMFLTLMAWTAPGGAQLDLSLGIVESVEARVGDEVITTSEVDERLQRVEMAELGRPFRDSREYEGYRRRELERLIQESLLVQEARRRGYQMDAKQKEAEVEQRWQRQVEMLGGEEGLRQYLERIGATEEALKKQMAEEVERGYLQERLLRAEVGFNVRVTPEEIEAFKQENPGLLDDLERVELSHILIAVPENASAEEEAEARRKAERLVTEIRARGSEIFESVASEQSDHEPTRAKGGRLGFIRRGELFKEFDIAFDLLPGEISEPIRTPQGYHILKVNEKTSIAERVRQNKIRESAQGLIDRLMDEAVVVVKGRGPEDSG